MTLLEKCKLSTTFFQQISNGYLLMELSTNVVVEFIDKLFLSVINYQQNY